MSYYTAKIRSYLIKKRIPYRELYPSHPDYEHRILPAIGLFVIPVLEAPGGELVQDTSDIIDYLEQRHPDPCFLPSTPVQRAVAALVNAYGSECLVQAAMHYRWSFLEEHGDYIRAEFARAIGDPRGPEERIVSAAPAMELMISHLPRLGISEETIPAIEAAYGDLLDVLNEHFHHHPYFLGGRPSIADFGMMAGLYAHLSRDPVPSALMKSRAPNVFRWTERMNVANIDDGEFPDAEPIFPPEDAVPPSLGPVSFEWRGITMRRNCAPQSLWHFDRAAACARDLEGDSLERWHCLLDRTGGERMMALELARPMRRENNVLLLA